jgi:hypothetical protein
VVVARLGPGLVVLPASRCSRGTRPVYRTLIFTGGGAVVPVGIRSLARRSGRLFDVFGCIDLSLHLGDRIVGRRCDRVGRWCADVDAGTSGDLPIS